MRPPEYHPPFEFKPPKGLIIRLVVAVFILIAAFQSLSFYVGSLWFQSLGFESVYWYRLRAEALVFLVFSVASAAILWILFRLVTPTSAYSRRPFLQVGGETIAIPSAQNIRRLTGPIAIIIGIFIGLSYSVDWNTYALFFNNVPTASTADPIFAQPLSFYLFTLPVLESVTAWFLAIALIGLVASILMSVIDMSATFRGVSLALSLLLLAIAAQSYVHRYSLLLDENSLFTGVRYVDDKIILPGLWFVIAALIAGAIIAAANVGAGRIRGRVRQGLPARGRGTHPGRERVPRRRGGHRAIAAHPQPVNPETEPRGFRVHRRVRAVAP